MDAGAFAVIVPRPTAGHRAVDHRDRTIEIDAGGIAPIAVVGPVVLEPAAVDGSAGGVKAHAAGLRPRETAPVGRAARDEAAFEPPARHPDVAPVAITLLSPGATVFDDAVLHEAIGHPDVAALAVVRF